MAIQYQCTNCNNIVQTPDDSGGKQGRCPHCSHIMTIPMASTAAKNAGPPVGSAPPAQPSGNPFADQPFTANHGSQPGPGFSQGQAPYGYSQPMPAGSQPGYSNFGGYPASGYHGEVWSDKSKVAAGLLGILIGSLGIHRFYLGFVGIGILQIIVTFVTCGWGGLWGFIEGILYLTGSMDRDAEGRRLRD